MTKIVFRKLLFSSFTIILLRNLILTSPKPRVLSNFLLDES